MEKNTRYFTYCYENDTTIEYVTTGLYAGLTCSYTSEDPAYGTDTLHYNAEPSECMEQLAYEMLQEVTEALDYRDSGEEMPRELKLTYDEYANSTLIAVEHALQRITKDFSPVLTNVSGNKIRLVTVKEACDIILESIAKYEDVEYDIVSEIEDHPIEYFAGKYYEGINYAVRWFDLGMVDGNKFDRIVVIAHWGGGYAETMYIDADEASYSRDELIKKMCSQVYAKPDEKIVLERIEKKGGDKK